MTAYIYRLAADHQPWDYAVEFDYSEEMVRAIKESIPSRQRKWVSDQKQWWFKGGATILAVCAMANTFCGGYVHVESAPAHRGPDDAYATLHLLPSAPPELVQSAYRTLAKMAHPDTGGDKATMQAINSAYQVIQKAIA